MRRLFRLLPFAALGPITGPIVYGLKGALDARRWAMAAVWAAALIEAWTLMSAAGLWAVEHV